MAEAISLFGTKWSGTRLMRSRSNTFLAPARLKASIASGAVISFPSGEIDPYFHKLFRENLRLSGVIGQNFFTDSLGH